MRTPNVFTGQNVRQFWYDEDAMMIDQPLPACRAFLAPRPILLTCVALWTAAGFAQRAEADEAEGPQILIVTNDAEDQSHAFIKLALAPKKQPAAFAITVARPAYLAAQPLDDFATIFLNDVAELTDRQHKALQQAVHGGAGLCFFLGDNAQVEHYNDVLYNKGEGIFPLPLGKPAVAPKGKAGIVAAEHPVLDAFEDGGQAMLDIVLVFRSHRPAEGWKADDEEALSVIARSAAGNPIAVSKPQGKGRVAALLFIPDRRWANWHFYPAWVVMLHELQTFLTES